jgi:hypothetical protein
MRIPLYRTQAAPTGEAPGRSIRARMSMEPFVNEAMSRGAVVGEAIAQVGKYAAMRYEAAVEAQLSEKLLGAEEALRNKAREMEQSSNPYSVFDTDNRWERETAAVKAQLAGDLKDRRALQKFNDSFGQMELGMRFSLRGRIDQRIQSAEAAALAARQAAYVAQESDPDTDAAGSDFMRTTIQNAAATGVAAGRFNGAAVAQSFTAMDLDIAKNIVPAYVGGDSGRAFALLNVLDAQDAFQRGDINEDQFFEAMAVNGLTDGPGQKTLSRLLRVPDDQALRIVQKAMDDARYFEDARRKEAERFETRQKDNVTAAYNRFFGFRPDTSYPINEVSAIIPISPELQALADGMGGMVNGGDVQREILRFTGSSNYLTPAQRETMEGALATAGMPMFPNVDDQIKFSTMLDLQQRGMLSVEMLQRNAFYLKQDTYDKLLRGIYTQADESVSLAIQRAKSQFGYDELLAADAERGRQAKASYFAVVGAIQTEAERARIAGQPLTSQQILARTDELIGEQMVFFKDALRAEYAETVQMFNQNTVGLDLRADDPDPIAALDAWYQSLPEEQQGQQSATYARYKTILRSDYISKGIFE